MQRREACHPPAGQHYISSRLSCKCPSAYKVAAAESHLALTEKSWRWRRRRRREKTAAPVSHSQAANAVDVLLTCIEQQERFGRRLTIIAH